MLNVIEKERPEGIIVQFGGQTPLSIAKPLQEALEKNPIPAASGASPFEGTMSCIQQGRFWSKAQDHSSLACSWKALQVAVRGNLLLPGAVIGTDKMLDNCAAGIGNTQIWGTQPDSIDEAEDRDRWMACLQRLDIKQPPGGMVTTEEGAITTASKLGYPVRQLQLPVAHRCCMSGAKQMTVLYSQLVHSGCGYTACMSTVLYIGLQTLQNLVFIPCAGHGPALVCARRPGNGDRLL